MDFFKEKTGRFDLSLYSGWMDACMHDTNEVRWKRNPSDSWFFCCYFLGGVEFKPCERIQCNPEDKISLEPSKAESIVSAVDSCSQMHQMQTDRRTEYSTLVALMGFGRGGAHVLFKQTRAEKISEPTN